MASRDIVVIGGSTGALEPLRHLVSQLSSDFPAAVFVAIHTSPDGPGLLPQVLTHAGALKAQFPADGEPIANGRIYVAPPDRHLVVKRGHVRVTRGPRENHFRPAVDPLFRTAAVAHGPRVIGVVLSGGQDDGAVGLAIIKDRGGIAIVQDPAEAVAPGMPEAAIRHVAVDHVCSIAALPNLLDRLTREHLSTAEAPMADELPRDIAEVGGHSIHGRRHPDAASPFTCPDCGGVLAQSDHGDLLQFECHVGHRYSGVSLMSAQDGALDLALWSGLRALEERAELRRRMAERARERNLDTMIRAYEEQARESELQADLIRRVLMRDAWRDPADDTSL